MKTIYIHETHTLYAHSGELHLCSDQGEVVFNMQNLFNDLPSITKLCIEEQDKNKNYILEQIKKTIK